MLPNGEIETYYTQEDYANPNADGSFPNIPFLFDPTTDVRWTDCNCMDYTPVIDGSLQTSIVWGSVNYIFTQPVSDIDIYNDTDWYAYIAYNNVIPTVWNNQHPIAPWQSVTFNAKDNELIQSVTITDIDQVSGGRYAIKWVRL